MEQYDTKTDLLVCKALTNSINLSYSFLLNSTKEPKGSLVGGLSLSLHQ